MGERAVGSLDEHPGARLEMGHGAALVTEALDRHP